MTVEKYLTYRGEIKAAIGVGGTLAFVTAHPEGQAAGLYRLDADKLTMAVDDLPGGGSALVADVDKLWLAEGDGQISETSASGGPRRPRGPKLEAPATALAPLADNRLAVLVGPRVLVLSRQDGKSLQTLDLPEPGACLAVDPSGRWLAAGTSKGTVAVFDAEGKTEFLLSASAKLHEGAVTAILFEPDDLRFFSAGADLKLFSTHARGKLEPEDKGRGNTHADLVTSLIWGPGERLFSGSQDGSIKSWPRAGAVKPATTRDGVGRVVAMALVTVHERPRLVAACDDNTLRFFPVDPAGKIGESSHRIHDAYALAKQELSGDDAPRRESALRALAGFGDARAVEMIADQAGADADHGLRLMAAEMLGASSHPRAWTLLESCLGHADEAVRVAAFRGLRRHLGESNLRPIDLALKADKADVGKMAVEALATLSATDDEALSRLNRAIDARTTEVRLAAMVALESAYDPRSPEPNLVALGSKHADVRRSALVRLFHRRLLDDPAVQSALRRSAEDADPSVRRTSFLLTLHTRERLLRALRSRDPELQRQLAELEGTDQQAGPTEEPPAREKGARKPKGKSPAIATSEAPLDDSDFEPLLQASASRALDSCLRGARGLAVLGDPRAFGLLLQLSREDEKTARAEVCRAMAALDDPRAIERLRSMLHDKEAEVRDAAFTALVRIHQGEPLLAAESGLNASDEDIRRRGLQALVAEARKPSSGETARQLLARALNDSFPAVRFEAFKSVLSLQVGGVGAGALRFASRSIHPDVRREVLTEVMAQAAEPWGLDLLLEFFNDPEPALRVEAFAFALKKTRGLEFLEAALGSRFADLRMKAVEGLVKRHTSASQALLVRALDDEDRGVRLAALASLVDSEARPALSRALDKTHPDVRLRAALALARHGDPKTLAPLVALASAPEPEERERLADWQALAESALEGLGELGDPTALPDLIPPLDSPHASIREKAARAMARIARPECAEALRQALRHADPKVKFNAAHGLACLGDASVASLVFSEMASEVLSPDDQIAAALALGGAGEDRLVVFLDDPREEVRSRALLLLMMREWKAPLGTAARCLACLSSRTPRFRLTAARAIESLTDPVAFASFVAGLVNDRGDQPDWKVDPETLDGLAEMLVHGGPSIQVRAVGLLRHLDAEEQDAFDQAWKVHEARFSGELADLRRQATKRKPVPLRYTPEQLQDLAFGAYVGLVREQASPKTRGQASGSDAQVIRVRQSALAHLLTLARLDPRQARAALPVFVQALGDPNQAVRSQAFEQAQTLGMASSSLAAEALASGHVDLGVRGLELLTGGTSEAEGRAVLEQAMLTRKDDLAIEAARLLIERLGPVAVGARALEAAHEPLRRQGVSWLAAEYDRDPAARMPLRLALGSRYGAIREAAAFELATKKDPAAFDALVGLLTTAEDPKSQRRVIEAMEALGDPRASDAFLDRVVHDPAATALADDLIRAAGRYRLPGSADRLLALLDQDLKRRDVVFAAVLMVSGYDQKIVDRDGELTDDRWEREQHPRHDDLLARLLDRFSGPAEAKFLARLVPGARWARGKAVDAPLARMVNHPDDLVRHQVVEALGWRLRKRDGDAEPLRKALGHRDPVTQFLAAEGLARAGRPDGLNVLLASIDFAEDLKVRRGAVLALGELADERAFEILLKLAGEDNHALQEPAAEAIGHMGRSPRSDEVFKLLERQSRSGIGIALSALRGLRWLDTRAGWQLIRARAADESFPFRHVAVELLGDDDEPATRDLLLRLVATLEWPVDPTTLEQAIESARRVFGLDSLEPDYAAVQNETATDLDDFDLILERVRDRGEPARIFEILPRCPEEAREAFHGCLEARAVLPVTEAWAALESLDPSTVGLAARVLGRAGEKAVGAGPEVEAGLVRWHRVWEEKRPTFDRDDLDEQDEELAEAMTSCVRDLVWAASRLGVSARVLAEVALAQPDDTFYRPIRREAVLALAFGAATPEAVDALESCALAGHLEVRAIAAQTIARVAPSRAEALAGRLLADAVGFRRLTLEGNVRVDEVLRDASRRVHYQGVVLSGLIDRGEVETLASVAEDRSLSEVTRLGALEGLAAMARAPAEDVLRRVGNDATDDEEIRKAAWRCLRRSNRAREKSGNVMAKAKAKAEVKP